MTVSTEMSAERQARAKEYAGIRRRLYFVRTAATFIVLALLVVTPLSKAVRTAIEGRASNQWLVVPLYVLLLGLAYEIVAFPLGAYSGWYLPRKYGLSHQSFNSWLMDLAKGSVIGGALGLGMVELLYWGLRRLPEWWWLAGGAVYLLFSVVLSNLAPVLIMPLFNKFTPIEDVTLRDRMLRLAERAGARVRGVFTMDFSRRTSAANAFVTGIGATRRIVLGDTLIANYTPEEVEVVMAHELGHHVHGDIWRGMAFDTVVTLVGLCIANLLLHAGVDRFDYRSVGDVAAFPLFALILSVFGLATMPLSNAYSRARERAADAYALTLTGNAPAFVTAMQRLANQNLAEMDPPPWVVWLFYSHPPLAERIQRGENFTAPALPDSAKQSTPAMVVDIGDGEAFDEAIIDYIRRKYKLVIGKRKAAEIKDRIGSAMPLNEDMIMDVSGRDEATGLPRTIQTHANEVTEALTKPLDAIIAKVRTLLDTLPPERVNAVVDAGILLTGRAALLRNITELLLEVTGVPHFVGEKPPEDGTNA